MTNRFALFLLFGVCLLAASCRTGPPEGVYPCTEATVATDCPTGWYCHSDDRCWSRIETFDGGTDGGVPVDAPMTDAPGHDAAPMGDSGPTCGTETCNGSDDDCDGRIDEGVLTVGATVAASATTADGARMIATGDGFLAVVPTASGPSHLSLLHLGLDGMAMSENPLGSTFDMQFNIPFEIAAMGGAVLIGAGFGASDHYQLGAVAAPGAGQAFAPWDPPVRTPFVASQIRLGAVSPTEAVVYVEYVSSTAGSATIRRLRMSLGGIAPTILGDVEIVADVEPGNGWTILTTSVTDYLLYYSTGGHCILMTAPTGAATDAPRLLGLADGACNYWNAMEIRDHDAPISGTNPLGIASEGLMVPLTFVQISSITPFQSTPHVLTDSTGAYRDPFTPDHLVSLLAVPTAGTTGGHWLLANIDQDPLVDPMTASARLQVREILGNAVTVRLLSVPGETNAARGHIDLVRSGTSTRVIERANTTGLVTRSIGCE